MTVFIIKRTDQGGGYLLPRGSRKAYTPRRDRAWRFASYEAADAERCRGSEIVVELPQ